MTQSPVCATASLGTLAGAYFGVKVSVLEAGFAGEILWQRRLRSSEITESVFLAETAWVVMSSGFRERVVSAIFPKVSRAFLDWRSSAEIVDEAEKCCKEAMEHFGHRRKIDALVATATTVAERGFDEVSEGISTFGSDYLQEFPYIGPITSRHLAKNLGVDCCKPDRHLIRLADNGGFDSVDDLCAKISFATGDSLSEIDIVLWRGCELGVFRRPEF